MSTAGNQRGSFARAAVVTGLASGLLAAGLATPARAQSDASSMAFEGLQRVDDSVVAVAYVDPEADFSVFKRVMILDPHVAFRSNWQRDQNRSRGRNIRASDMTRIKEDVAALFKEVFAETLSENDGYEIVDQPDYDVLLLRPAIVDLDVAAPDVATAGRTRSFTSSAGAATLYIELFDSVSGDLIGRAADRRAGRNMGGITWSTRVTNTAEARRMFRRWAGLLRDFLDQHYSGE